MPRFEDGSYGSQPGVALIAKVLAGRCKMKYTRAAVGKGTIPENLTPKTMTGCADYVMDAKIASITNPVDGECQVTVQILSDDVESGFYLTNIVLFAEDPDDGEVPYTYLSMENEPEWIRPSSSIVGKLATFEIIAAVGDVDTVEAVIDPDSLVTHKELIRLLDRYAIGAAKRSLTIPTSGWTADADTGGTYPRHLDIASAEITEDMVPVVSILPQSLSAAIACGLCPACRTLPGLLRFYAKSAPASDIQISLALLDTVPQGSNLASSAAAGRLDIEIPVEGWTDSGEAAYPYSTEIRHGLIEASMIPLVAILPEFLEVAVSSGMSPVAETLSGALRVYAKQVPEAPIRASLALLRVASDITGSIKPDTSSGYVLPAATGYVLGGVKVQRGSGLAVDGEGNLSLDTAPKDAVVNLFKGSKG